LIRFTRHVTLNHSHIANIHLPERRDVINFLIFFLVFGSISRWVK